MAGVVLAWHWRGSVKATARDGEGGLERAGVGAAMQANCEYWLDS